jgi:hypothetical protein
MYGWSADGMFEDSLGSHGARPDPPITVHMDSDQVVIWPDGDLDTDATEALTDAVNAAVSAGSVVVVDLDRSSPVTAMTDGEPSGAARPTASDTNLLPAAVAAGPGHIRLASAASCWTVDLGSRRLCRSHAPVDYRFVPADSWTAVRKLWISPSGLSALTSPDSFVSARRAGMA